MAGFKLDLKGIKEYLQNRHPYLMIDYVDEKFISSNSFLLIVRK